jgi:hypothetical protein
VKELLDGKRIDMPPLRQTSVTFRRAPKAKVEFVTRLGSMWDDTARTENTDAADDIEEQAAHRPQSTLVPVHRVPIGMASKHGVERCVVQVSDCFSHEPRLRSALPDASLCRAAREEVGPWPMDNYAGDRTFCPWYGCGYTTQHETLIWLTSPHA